MLTFRSLSVLCLPRPLTGCMNPTTVAAHCSYRHCFRYPGRCRFSRPGPCCLLLHTARTTPQPSDHPSHSTTRSTTVVPGPPAHPARRSKPSEKCLAADLYRAMLERYIRPRRLYMSNQIKFCENPGLSGRKSCLAGGSGARTAVRPVGNSVVMTPPSEAAAAGTGGGRGIAGGQPGRPAADYPVVLSLAGRPCLVVGGGPVAARKARGLVGRRAPWSPWWPPGQRRPSAELTSGTGSVAVERRPYRRRGGGPTTTWCVTATGDPSVDGPSWPTPRPPGYWSTAPMAAAPRHRPAPRGPQAGARDRGRVHRRRPARRWPGGCGTGSPPPSRPGWRRWPTWSTRPGTEVRASGRSTDSVDWSRLLDRVDSPWWRPAGSTRPGLRSERRAEQSLTDPRRTNPQQAPG